MSLVPYSSREGREIVLRHDDAIVIRDPQTQQLILRGVATSPTLPSTCPTCSRPYSTSPPKRDASPQRPAPFINPEYFRMLHDNHSRNDVPPSSPIRRLVEPALHSNTSSQPGTPGSSLADAEFVNSTPSLEKGHSIKKEAFSPNYFKRFFTEEKELGRGGKGVVLLVKHELDGVFLGHFACKRVPVGDDHAWLEKVLIEVQLLQGLSHPNLVSYRHVWLEDVQLNRFSPSVPCAFILQQYCNSGDLLHYIIGPGMATQNTKERFREQLRRRSRGHSDPPDIKHALRKLSFEEIYSFFKDITSGLAHLHASNYIHRDLKPSNCLLHRDGADITCLISDFGEVQAENVVRKSTGSTGTISYCAPEVLKRNHLGQFGNFTTKSDIFSLGMILYFMCFGRLPYQSADSIQEDFEDMDLLRAEISSWSGFKDERKERPELPNQLYNFLKRLLALDPTDRPSANEILQALRTEKVLEVPSRARNGSNIAMSARVLQSVDSLMPETPVNDIKRVDSAAYIEDASVSDSSGSTSSPTSQLRFEEHAHNTSRKVKQPLLMAPPTTLVATVKHRISIYRHYTTSWMRSNSHTVQIVARLGVFLLKMISITRPCSPVATRESVWYPLIAIAALELALGQQLSWRSVGMLAALHMSCMWLAITIGGGICFDRRPKLNGTGHLVINHYS